MECTEGLEKEGTEAKVERVVPGAFRLSRRGRIPLLIVNIFFLVLGKCTTVLDMRVVEAGEFALVRRYVCQSPCRDLVPFFLFF